METSESQRLISLYKKYKCLWDPSDFCYTNRGVRDDAWRQISCAMDKPIEDLKKKMRSLAGGFRREKFREKKSRVTGSGAEDIYKSKWFAYDDFAFMAKKKDPGTTHDTLQHETRPEKRQHTKINDHLESDNNDDDDNASSDLEQPPASRRKDEPEVLAAHKDPDSPISKGRVPYRSDNYTNECELYGQLLSKKLLKLDETNRLRLMNKIDNLVFNTTMRILSKNKANSTSSLKRISLEDSPEENYIIQVVKRSLSREDPLTE